MEPEDAKGCEIMEQDHREHTRSAEGRAVLASWEVDVKKDRFQGGEFREERVIIRLHHVQLESLGLVQRRVVFDSLCGLMHQL